MNRKECCNLRVIGITGGTGGGKSTVTKILSGLGAKVLDADLIAKQVTGKGEKALAEVVDYFGKDILDESGELDRRKLGEIVFNDPGKLEVLSRITHKYVIERIIEGVNRAREEKNVKILVIDAPIPVEHGFIDQADEIWVVTAEPEIRIRRIMERSGLSYEEAFSRVHSQKKDETYFEIADRIIYNSWEFEKLREEVLKLLENSESSIQGDVIV